MFRHPEIILLNVGDISHSIPILVGILALYTHYVPISSPLMPLALLHSLCLWLTPHIYTLLIISINTYQQMTYYIVDLKPICVYIYKYISMDISLYYSYTQWIYPMDI